MALPAKAVVLAVDAGLTVCKAAAFDLGGEILATAAVPAPPRRRRGAASATYCHGVWGGVRRVLAALVAELGAGVPIRAVVLSTAGVGGLAVDPSGRVAGMTRPDAADMARMAAHPGWRPYGPEGYASSWVLAAQLARHRSEVPEGPRLCVGSLHTYLVWRLTGRWVADPASGPGQLAWPAPLAEMAARFDLPELLPNEAVVGPLRAPVARAVGLGPGIQVVLGGHDGVLASFGSDAYRDGDCCFTLGTNFVPRPVSARRIGAGFAYPIRPGAWAWSLEVSGAGRSLNSAAELLDPSQPSPPRRHDRLAALAAPAAVGGAAPAPELLARDAALRRWVAGRLARGDSPGQVYGAVVDTAVDALVARLAEARCRGFRPTRYLASGGFALNRLVTGRLAGRLDARITIAGQDAGLKGAAALAAAALGAYPSPEEALPKFVRLGPEVDPAPVVTGRTQGA